MKTRDLEEVLSGMEAFDGVPAGLGVAIPNPPIVKKSPASERAAQREETRAALAMAKMSADDFRVCENCGGPAVVHPRFEMAQIVCGSKAILCCDCLHEATFPPPPIRKLGEMRISDQLWKCDDCGETRAWGIAQPWDATLRALLNCGGCDRPTRHRFAGIFGRRLAARGV